MVGKETERRELETMPFDKAFYRYSDGRRELCHSTGYEVCHGDPSNLADWYDEYEDSDGELHYGR